MSVLMECPGEEACLSQQKEIDRLREGIREAINDFEVCHATAEAADPLPVAKWMRENSQRGINRLQKLLEEGKDEGL